MLDIRIDKTINRLLISTEDKGLHFFLEARKKSYEYIPFKKQWGYIEKLIKIYDKKTIKKGIITFTVGLGWTGYILNIFKDKIRTDVYNNIIQTVILSNFYREHPFPELRDYQNEDVLYLLKYKMGLFQVQTGYGKSQVIAVLTNYAHEVLGKKVLLVCPSKKARDELIKRCKKLYNIDVSDSEKTFNGHLDCLITAGVMNSKRITDPDKNKEFNNALAKYDWVLVDEVEYTINNSGEYIYDHCTGAERFYGFSGTADKENAEIISFVNGLSEVVTRNRNLVKYFGPSIIYRMPLNKVVNNIKIKTSALDKLKFDKSKLSQTGNIYGEILNQTWTDPSIIKVIIKIVEAYPLCFIPFNNLSSVLNDWIDNYFVGKFNTLLICYEGYIYIDKQGNRTKLDLTQCCDYINQGLVDVIPSTSSGFRALDLPGLKNILIVTGKIAGVHLQVIGRVARSDEFNIISLEPKTRRKIPVYTKSSEEREKLMKSFYKYCDIRDIEIDEENL